MTVDDETAAGRLRRLRRARLLSQAELSERSGVSVRSIRALESGEVARPHPTTLEQLAAGLNLEPGARTTFVAMWHPDLLPAPKLDADLTHGQIELDGYLSAELRRSRAATTTVSRSVHSFVDEAFRLSRTTDVRAIRAREPGVDRALCVYHREDDLVDWERVRLTGLDNCRLGRVTVVPEHAMKVFELLLDARLAEGETYIFEHTLDLGDALPARRRPPGEVRTGVGVLDPNMSIALQVTCDPAALPARVTYEWSDRALGRPRTVREIRMSRSGRASLAVKNAATGIHQLTLAPPA